jgi:protein-tyrosine phosphatase
MFQFVEEAISKGDSVLVHCLAGAHRAGTTGVSCLIHFADLQVDEAIRAAKKCRPIIDPIGQLPEFLKRLRAAEDYRERRGLPRFKFETE